MHTSNYNYYNNSKLVVKELLIKQINKFKKNF